MCCPSIPPIPIHASCAPRSISQTNRRCISAVRPLTRYYEQNIGRVVKTRKVWIGEIEVYAEDMYYVTDAYAWVDVSEPGRLAAVD